MPTIHAEVLPRPQARVWKRLQDGGPLLRKLGFYLAGGTGLALQIGHRRSVDFDFFSRKKNVSGPVVNFLKGFRGFTLRDRDADTVHADVGGVKLSFIGGYKYPAIEKPVRLEEIPVAGILDIALMKLLAISHRAAIRDYIDLAVIVRDHVPLSHIVARSQKKYGTNFNPMVSIRALTFTGDVKKDMPTVFDPTLRHGWQRILREAARKSFFLL